MASGCGRRRVSGVCVGLVMAGSGVLAGPAGAAKDDLVLVSRASGADGAKANELTTATALSADGRFAAFRSQASNLDPADTDTIWDMFVRDLQTGALTLVSRASGATGVKGNDLSLGGPALSADGRFVAFSSWASNLDPDDTDRPDDVYVRDLQTNTTTLVSRASGAAGAKGNGASVGASMSADGRFVAFRSSASNLDPGDNDTIPDVFVRDLQTNTTTLVSRGSGAAGAKGSNSSLVPAISADGRYVAFSSFASNLDPDDTDTSTDVFVRDLQASTTTLVSRASGAAGAKGNGASRVPVISPGGRFVAFDSNASNLHPDDTDATGDAFVRDLQAGTTTLISRASGADGAKGNDDSLRPVISADGRFVAFDSTASNLDPADTDTTADVYMRDVQANTTTLVSRASGPAGAKGNFFSLGPAMSRDGRFVGFVSGASNLDPADTDFSWDVFVRDVLGPPPPTPAPPPSATPSRPASAVMRLRVLGVSVLGRTGARARCVMRTGRVRSCNVRLLRGRRLVARGRAAGAPATRRTVELRLTRYGRALLTRRLGGVRVRARATGATSAGLRHARARSRALLAVEHATTPPGAWQPDRAALTARGRRFLRRIRGRLIAVSALRCHGYTAKLHAGGRGGLTLSRRRAARTCAVLARDRGHVARKVFGHGDARPIAANRTAAGRARNRRVEITIVHRHRRL